MLREKLLSEEATAQTKLKGAEVYHDSVVSNKEAQIQAWRSQVQQLSEAEPKEDWMEANWLSRRSTL